MKEKERTAKEAKGDPRNDVVIMAWGKEFPRSGSSQLLQRQRRGTRVLLGMVTPAQYSHPGPRGLQILGQIQS